MRSTNTTPRRLKRNGNKSAGSGTTTSTSDEGEKTDSRSKCSLPIFEVSDSTCRIASSNRAAGFSYPAYIVTSQPTSIGSDSEQSVTSQCSFVVQPADPAHHLTYAIAENDDADFYDEDELWKLEDGEYDEDAAVYRPAPTPVSSRKPRFQFTGKFAWRIYVAWFCIL